MNSCRSWVNFQKKIAGKSGVTKKRHDHNFQNFGSISNQHGAKWVSLPLIQYGAEILKILAVFFFFWRLVISMTDQFFRTHPSLTAYSSRSKPHTPNKLHIFGKLWTWAFAWSYPGFFFFEQISRNERFMKKLVFLHFFVSAPKKNSSGRRSDNIDASGLPNTSSESLCPKVFREHVKNAETLKIRGSIYSPPKSVDPVSCPSEKLVFRQFFGRNPRFDWLRPNVDPAFIYIIGKLWISAFSWYFWKNIFWIR